MLVVVATSARAAGQDEDFLAARDAFFAGDAQRLENSARQLSGHLLEPYATYWQLSLRLEEASPEEVRAFLAADSGPRGGDRPGGDSRSGFEPYGDLTLGVDHEQALVQRRRSAGARQACSRKIEGPGGGFLVGRSGHARTLP